MRVRSGQRPRLTAAAWRKILARFERSNLSIQAFCDRESLSTSSFHRWRRKLVPQSESFVELAVPAAASDPSAWTVELELSGHILLRVRG
jgi:hypothetical protein